MSQSYDRISIMGLYTADKTLFDEIVLPSSITAQTREDLINNILIECYELETMYPDPAITKKALGMWSRKYLPGWEKALEALEAKYNPIHNFDRYEESTDARLTSNQGATVGNSSSSNISDTSDVSNGSSRETSQAGNETTNKVMGFDQGKGWADHDKSISSGNDTNENVSAAASNSHGTDSGTINTSESRNDSGREDNAHAAHLFGNIGVVTSQSMVRDEWSVRIELNFINMVTELFKQAFCVLVY